MAERKVLVTGGAGYIGSHTCHRLVEAGFGVVVLDNLYSGHPWAVPEKATFVRGDAGDAGLVRELIRRHAIDAVVHFAGHIIVPESVADPLKYYHNNVAASRQLIEPCIAEGVGQFVFSSSAAVYGIPGRSAPIGEDAALAPINPYGRTKLIVEWMLEDAARAFASFRYVALRYFNVAGARLDGTLGQATRDSTHLIKIASEAACGLRDRVSIFGTDYPTPDGTCVRDYIHVEDLARAHIDALAYLRGSGASSVLNCGYGKGYSVREILKVAREVSGVDFPIEEAPRRAGDPPSLVADARRIGEVLGWRARHDDIRVVCESAIRWERSLQRRSESQKP
jgi:UDP-glucose 4-epimerase